MAFGLGTAAIVLSSWMVELTRASYRERGGIRSTLANATPLWMGCVTGVLMLFISIDWLTGWAKSCVPTSQWSAPGIFLVVLGLLVALIAIGRMILGRVRGRTARPAKDTDTDTDTATATATATANLPAALAESSPDALVTKANPSKLPTGRRRVAIEYALTYLIAVITILIGVGVA
jgi:MFS family permease